MVTHPQKPKYYPWKMRAYLNLLNLLFCEKISALFCFWKVQKTSYEIVVSRTCLPMLCDIVILGKKNIRVGCYFPRPIYFHLFKNFSKWSEHKLKKNLAKGGFRGNKSLILWMLAPPWPIFKKSFTKWKFDKIDILQCVLYIIRVINCRY